MTAFKPGALLDLQYSSSHEDQALNRFLREHRITAAQYKEMMELLDRFLQCRINGEATRQKDFDEGLTRIFFSEGANIYHFLHTLVRILMKNKIWFDSHVTLPR